MEDYISEAWRPVLENNGIADFDALWQLEAGWFEAPNQRRGGWSGVSRYELTTPDGDKLGIFLKRQENHKTFSWRHPVKGVPTFLREFRHIMRYRAYGVPTLEPVYFAMRETNQGHRAIIVTVELEGFVSLETLVLQGALSFQIRKKVLQSVAALAGTMHRNHIQHNCFYPKHVFVRLNDNGDVEARVIDLEKSRWRPTSRLCALRDLDTLNRHSCNWSRTDRLRFLLAYMQIQRLSPQAKSLWQRLAGAAQKKSGN